MRRLVRVVAVVALLLAVLRPAAYAHTEALRGSTPGRGSVVTSLDAVELRFVDRVSVASATFTLRSADRAGHALAAPVWSGDDSVVVLRPTAMVPEGRYRVGYQVIFADGHPAAGVVEIEVSADGVARAPAWPSGDPVPAPEKERFSAGAAVPWLVSGSLLLLVVLSIALLRTRRSRPSGVPQN